MRPPGGASGIQAGLWNDTISIHCLDHWLEANATWHRHLADVPDPYILQSWNEGFTAAWATDAFLDLLLSLEDTAPGSAVFIMSANEPPSYSKNKRHILPLIQDGLIERTIPEKPNSRLQKYGLAEKGKFLLL